MSYVSDERAAELESDKRNVRRASDGRRTIASSAENFGRRGMIRRHMVTYDQIWNHLSRRPFQPFRLTLTDGETIDIVRTNQAATNMRLMIVGTATGDGVLRWIRHEKIGRIQAFELPAKPTVS
jgi:hypothetical protein